MVSVQNADLDHALPAGGAGLTQTAFIRSPGGLDADDSAAQLDPTKIVTMSLNRFTGRALWRVALMHDRPENMLIWITRGQGRVYVNGLRRGVGAHNALFLPKGTLFALDLAPQSLAQVVLSPRGRTGLLPRTPLHLRVRDGLAQAELTGEIEAMQREMQLKRPHLQEALAARLGLVAVWLRRQVHAGMEDTPYDNAALRLSRRFAGLLVERYQTDWAMQDYAAALDVTPTHLTRVCRECSGFTAADQITQRKLHEAWRRLEESEDKVSEIADDLGFHSAAYFTRFVQAHTGVNPTTLRRAAQR